MAGMNSNIMILEKRQEEKTKIVLEAYQKEIRYSIRQSEEMEAEKLDRKLLDLQNQNDRRKLESIWDESGDPMLEGVPIRTLPKDRTYWQNVEFQKMSIAQLKAILELLCLQVDGKKMVLKNRLRDWVDMPQILARERALKEEKRRLEEYEASGSVFTFGGNASGQLGIGNRDSCVEPVLVLALKGKRIKQVVTGFDADFAFALNTDGEVFVWGGNGTAPLGVPKGQLRMKTRIDDVLLCPNLHAELKKETITKIACSRNESHAAACTEGGQCLTWGQGDYGQLGTSMELQNSVEPEEVSLLVDRIIVDVAVGNSHTVALTDDGQVYSWGACWGGQLGLGTSKRAGVTNRRLASSFPKPTLISTLRQVIIDRISCGAVHTALISNEGHLYTFGCSDGGRLGLGDRKGLVLVPEVVDSLTGEWVSEVCCSNWHTLCIVSPRTKRSKGGWVYAFGSGINGQLGLGKQRTAHLPTRIPLLANLKVKCSHVSASSYHNCAISTDGDVYTWGKNVNGCLGRFTTTIDTPDPGLVGKLKVWGLGPAVSASCGHQFTIVLTAPWKGIDKDTYQSILELNQKPKLVEGIHGRLSSTSKPIILSVDDEEEQCKPSRARRCSFVKSCPGFELETSAPSNVYICHHCRLPRRMHDIQ